MNLQAAPGGTGHKGGPAVLTHRTGPDRDHMDEADENATILWRSAEIELEPWFDSGLPFERMPEELQALLSTRGRAALPWLVALWNDAGPLRRREIARQRDFTTHPDLTAAQEAVFQATGEVHDRRRVATAKRLEDRDARDVIAQRQDVLEAEGRLRAAEVTLDTMARRLGLNSGELEAPAPLLKPVTSKDLPEWLTGLQTVTWLLLRDAAYVLAAGPHEPPNRALRAFGNTGPGNLDTSDPAEWGGVSDFWLAIRAGNAQVISDALERLLGALRAGRVRSVLTDQTLPADGWARLRLHFDQTGKQVFAAWHSDLMQGPAWATPMFFRDDVLVIREAGLRTGTGFCPPRGREQQS